MLSASVCWSALKISKKEEEKEEGGEGGSVGRKGEM